VEIDRSSEQAGELALQACKGEAWGAAGLKFDEDVDIAGRAEIVPNGRTEKSESTHVVTTAEDVELGFREIG